MMVHIHVICFLPFLPSFSFQPSCSFSGPLCQCCSPLLSFVPALLCPVTPGSHQQILSLHSLHFSPQWVIPVLFMPFPPSCFTIVTKSSTSPSNVSFCLPLSLRVFPVMSLLSSVTYVSSSHQRLALTLTVPSNMLQPLSSSLTE